MQNKKKLAFSGIKKNLIKKKLEKKLNIKCRIKKNSFCFPRDTPGFPQKISAQSFQPFGRL